MIDQEYLTTLLVEERGYSRREAKAIYKLIFGTIYEQVRLGNPVKLPRIGRLYRADLEAYTARNPRTGDRVDVPDRYRIKVSGKPFTLS